MRKILLSLCIFGISFQLIASVFAIYSQRFEITDNLFQAGKYALQLSTTDSDGDNIADTFGPLWQTIPSSLWTTPDDWLPGNTVTNTVFVRAGGTLDIPHLRMAFQRAGAVGQPLHDYIYLTEVWYDKNADGVVDESESLLAWFIEKYDENNDGKLSMTELTKNGGSHVMLEKESPGLPGSRTNATVGGPAGTGRAIRLSWQLDHQLPLEYGGSSVKMNVSFYSQDRET